MHPHSLRLVECFISYTCSNLRSNTPEHQTFLIGSLQAKREFVDCIGFGLLKHLDSMEDKGVTGIQLGNTLTLSSRVA
jgi:hypothetical protein